VVWSPNVKAIRQYFRLENKENMNIKWITFLQI
jgi:hypothetical protein